MKNGCLRRSDIMIDCSIYNIIIEIDEDQHRDYNEDDEDIEEIRMKEISDALNKPLIFIRFNPDKYTDKDNKKYKSCFENNKETGLIHISDRTQGLWIKRLEVLKSRIDYYLNIEKLEKTINIKLFYDD